MRKLNFVVLSVFCGLALAQDEPSDLFDKAPPAIDEALRTRVSAFYQAHVDAKFRAADQYVAEDSKDAFFVAQKPHYKSCQIAKITYSENFTKATAVTSCKDEISFRGQHFTATMPMASQWRIEDGQWFWYYVQRSEKETPFGTMKASPESGEQTSAPAIPSDPLLAARAILARVTVDATAVTVDQTRSSTQEIHVKNGMVGPITLSVDPTGVPGLTMKPVKSEVPAGEETSVMVAFNFDDPAILCQECLVNPGVRPPATVLIHVEPTAQQFPVQINFTQPGPKNQPGPKK
jgi:hypothetical protein